MRIDITRETIGEAKNGKQYVEFIANRAPTKGDKLEQRVKITEQGEGKTRRQRIKNSKVIRTEVTSYTVAGLGKQFPAYNNDNELIGYIVRAYIEKD